MIKIENLTKHYGQVKVFENFNLNIDESKVTCILGESGSGKTTLLNVLANLTSFSGKVIVNKCSYVFQTPNLFPNLTVNENLALILDDQQVIDKYLKEFEVFEQKNQYPYSLSGGQASRVSLIRGLIFNAPVLLLDEPFSSLDLALKYKLLKKVKEHHQEKNNTIIMVTHDVKEAITIADRIIVLKKGNIVTVYDTVNDDTERQIYNLLIGKQI